MIKSCPMCEGDVCRVCPNTSSIKYGAVKCLQCGLLLSSHVSQEEADKLWNTRPREEELLKIIKQVQVLYVLGNCDEQEAFEEWLKLSNKLEKTVDETIKKYEAK